MKRILLFHNGETLSGGGELLDQWRTTPGSWIWVDLQGEAVDQEWGFLSREFGIEDLHITEAQRPRHPPSLRVQGDQLFVLLKPLAAESRDLDFKTLQLALFRGPGFLVTRRSGESPYLNRLWERAAQGESTDLQSEHIVASMVRRVVDRYGAVLLDLEVQIDEIEDTLLESQNENQLQELVLYNTQLRRMRRVINYHVHVFEGLQTRPTLFNNEPVYDSLCDSYTLMERFSSLAELYQNVITDLIEGYISLNGHRLNQIMKVLTIVTVMFAPLALLVGIYGMNFENMPELKAANGYYVLLMVMGLFSGGLLLLFRRLKWV